MLKRKSNRNLHDVIYERPLSDFIHADSVVLGAFYKIDAPYTASHFARAMLLYNRSHYGGHKEKNLFEVFTRRGISVSL